MSVVRFASVDVAKMVAWINAIPFEEWPQQHRLPDGKIRPAMVTDLSWHNFGEKTDDIVMDLYLRLITRLEDDRSITIIHGRVAYNRMLSVVMPGQPIPPHRDVQESHWYRRVHIPLATNEHSMFLMRVKEAQPVVYQPYHMEVGSAYLVDVQTEHAVTNDGDTPRIHFMFDVRKF